jgi:hypothetical protein
MTPRHIETRVPAQPVRIYKLLAITFLAITIVLLAVIGFMSSKRATITITTKETPVETNVRVALADVGGGISVVTTTQTQTFFVTGGAEVPGKATGMMRIYNTSATAQPLVATTRFLSSTNVLFRLKSGVVVPANGFIDAEVAADKEGKEGNVGPDSFTIPGLDAARQKEVYGKTESAMQGGVRTQGVVSQKDLDTAKATLEQKMLDTAASAFTVPTATSTKALYTVSDTVFSTNVKVGDTVSEFSATVSGVLKQASYDTSVTYAKATESLYERVVDDTEHIDLGTAEPVVTLGVVTSDPQTTELSVVLSGVATLNPDSPKLEKNVFFGKTKDEIRRYVLTMDHVHGVDIHFSPAWMQTVPHVNEHVDVVIKEVK